MARPRQICHDLELHGLIEDDSGMELLVAGRIISLSLPVRLVYEKVWQPHAAASGEDANSIMRVVYRLQGLDGMRAYTCAAYNVGRVRAPH